jgi:hypothetical protein
LHCSGAGLHAASARGQQRRLGSDAQLNQNVDELTVRRQSRCTCTPDARAPITAQLFVEAVEASASGRHANRSTETAFDPQQNMTRALQRFVSDSTRRVCVGSPPAHERAAPTNERLTSAHLLPPSACAMGLVQYGGSDSEGGGSDNVRRCAAQLRSARCSCRWCQDTLTVRTAATSALRILSISSQNIETLTEAAPTKTSSAQPVAGVRLLSSGKAPSTPRRSASPPISVATDHSEQPVAGPSHAPTPEWTNAEAGPSRVWGLARFGISEPTFAEPPDPALQVRLRARRRRT